MTKNLLKLNTDKKRYLLFGTPQQLSKVNRPTFAATSDIIQLSLYESNLGVLLDSSLAMKDHIDEVSKRSFQHFRNISHKEIVNFGSCKNSDSCTCMFTDS